MTTTLPVLCLACSRYAAGGCTAFPGGIPADIITRGADHRASRAGEPPFEQAPGREREFADWLALHNAG